MEQNNVLKYLVPVIALVVLGESVMLIMNLNKKVAVMPVKTDTVKVATGTVNMPSTNQTKVYDIKIAGKPSVKLGANSEMSVVMAGNTMRNLDAVSLYVKYDPQAFDITGLTYDKKLATPSFSKVSTTKGLVVVNFLFTNVTGLKVDSGEELTLAKFNIKPKMEGNFNFEISSGNESKESATMIVENATSQVLPYSSNILTVNVAK